MSSSSGYKSVSNRYTPPCPIFSISLRLPRRVEQCSIPCRIGFGTVLVNGTVVLRIIGLVLLVMWEVRQDFLLDPDNRTPSHSFQSVCLRWIGLLVRGASVGVVHPPGTLP
jgi:hypothetical protein